MLMVNLRPLLPSLSCIELLPSMPVHRANYFLLFATYMRGRIRTFERAPKQYITQQSCVKQFTREKLPYLGLRAPLLSVRQTDRLGGA